MCLVSTFPFFPSPIVARPTFAPVSCTRLLLYPFFEPSTRPENPTPHIIDYTNIWSKMKYCIITPALLVISLLSLKSCNIDFLAHVLLSGFLGWAFSGSCSIGIHRGSRRFLRKYCTIQRTHRGVLWKLISFSALHNVCERVFLISLDAQQRYSPLFSRRFTLSHHFLSSKRI